jgi:small basic protein
MIALPLSALVIGFTIVYKFLPAVPPRWGDYVALATLAGLDAVVGAFRYRLEQRFNEAVFVSGFFANMIVAGALAYSGDKLGVDLYLAVVLALGIRIFNNLGRVRGLLVRAHLATGGERAAAAPR